MSYDTGSNGPVSAPGNCYVVVGRLGGNSILPEDDEFFATEVAESNTSL